MTTLGFITNIVFFFAGVYLGIIVMRLNKINNKEYENEEKDI